MTYCCEGSRISAVIDRSDEWSEDVPCVVFGHGYRSYKDEFGGALLGQLFCDPGFCTLRMDFRGSGDGVEVNPRGKTLIGTEWPLDLMNAVAFASALEGIDTERLAILGVSGGVQQSSQR